MNEASNVQWEGCSAWCHYHSRSYFTIITARSSGTGNLREAIASFHHQRL